MPEAITPITKMIDLQIHSTVNLERYAESVRKKVIQLLNDVQDEVISTLTKTDTKRPITQWKRKRLSQLQMTIDGIADKSFGEIRKLVDAELKDLSIFTGKETVGNINKVIGADIANITLTQENLRAIVNSTMIDGQIIGAWWEDQREDFKKRAIRQITDATQQIQLGLVRGEAIGEMVKRIRGTALIPGVMDMSRKNATSLVRTSVMQVANEARWDMYESNSDLIKGYEIVATLDKRTTPQCRALDGKRWERLEDGSFKPIGGHGIGWPGKPPYHWQCRTTIVPLLKSLIDLAAPDSKLSKSQLKKLDNLTPAKRAAMTYNDSLAALGKSAPGTMTYDGWLKTQPEAVQIDILGSGRFKLWKENKLSMADMVHQNGRPLSIKELEEKFE